MGWVAFGSLSEGAGAFFLLLFFWFQIPRFGVVGGSRLIKTCHGHLCPLHQGEGGQAYFSSDRRATRLPLFFPIFLTIFFSVFVGRLK